MFQDRREFDNFLRGKKCNYIENIMKFVDKADDKGGGWDHRRELPVIHYHGTMVTYPYPFLVEMTQFFS